MQSQTQQSVSEPVNSSANLLSPSRKEPFRNSSKLQEATFTSNYYQVQFPKNSILHQLKVSVKPQLKQNSQHIWTQVLKNLYFTYQKQLKLVFWDGHSLWSLHSLQKNVNTNWKYLGVDGKQNTQYEVEISLLSKVQLSEPIKDQTKRKSLTHGINLLLKSKLQKLDLTQFKKEHFYKIESMSQDCLTEIQVQILRGFHLSIFFLANNQICLKIFPIQEVLQINSFLQTLKSIKEQKFHNQFVVARYGKFKTYKVEKIQHEMSPNSTFYDLHKSRTISFKDYYLQKYQIQIEFNDQPLIRVKRNTQKKIGEPQKQNDIFLIPQLLALIGLTKTQRQDVQIERLVNFTKVSRNNIKSRLEDVQKVIESLNSQFIQYEQTSQSASLEQSVKDLQFKIKLPIRVKGYHLKPVNLIFTNQNKVPEINGHFSHRQQLYQKGKFEDWMIFYSSHTSQIQIESFQAKLIKVSQQLGIKVDSSFFCKIQYQKTHEDKSSKQMLWIQAIEGELQKYEQLPQFIVCYFKPDQAHFCFKLNKLFVNKYGVRFQNVNSHALQKKPFAILTSLAISINQKVGFTPWKIDLSNLKTIYSPNQFPIACVSYSLYKRGNQYTFGFIGSCNKQLTKIFTFSRTGIKSLDELTKQFYQIPFNSWLKWCFSKSTDKNNVLPKVIVVYRKEIHGNLYQKQVQRQVDALKDVIKDKIPKKLNYQPEIIVVNVDENSNSLFYTERQNADPLEAKCGNFVGQQMSKKGVFDFHLQSNYQITKCNVATGYLLAYRSKCSVSQEDLIAFTYSQCFNFCGNFQSLCAPSWLVCAQKLSKFVGKYVGENVIKKSQKGKNERQQQIIDSYYFL